MKLNRRQFLVSTAAATAGGAILPGAVAAAPKQPPLYIVHGTDPEKLLAKGLEKLGGIARFVKKGSKVTIKPNAAWASRPEQAGNTHPELVKACIIAAKSAGAKEVVLPENPCSPEKKAFGQSGIGKAAAAAGGRLYAATADGHYQPLCLPKGKVLKEVKVVKDIIETDCLINMPVVKSHGGAIITVSMKNWMGSVQDRRVWHNGQLHQCIADCSTGIKPALIIADATRIMTTNGPQGPGEIATPNQLIFGTDPVAVDAYAATLFNKKPFDIPYIKLAHTMGIGCGDLDKIDIQHVKL